MISLLVLLEELSVIQLVGSLAQCLARGQCSANVNYSVGSQCLWKTDFRSLGLE